MALNLAKTATDLISSLGYTGLSLGLVIDSLGIPIPSEVLLPLAGALAKTGRFNVWIVFVVGTLAQLIGGLIGYYIGRYGGEPFLHKYGKYVLISHRDLERVHRVFAKRGPILTMVGRCIPFIRGLVGYPAGIAEMRLSTFIIFTTIGSAVWTALFVYLGYLVGDHLQSIDSIMNKLTIIVVIAIVAAIGWHARNVWRERRA